MAYNFKTRKDNRHREWPAGKNDGYYKKKFNRRMRKMLKNIDYLVQGGSHKKMNCSWDINDFK